MRGRTSARRLIACAVVLGAMAAAVADDKGPHGALTPQAQLALLEQMGITGVGTPPPQVDVTAWHTLNRRSARAPQCAHGAVSVQPTGLVDAVYNLWNRNPIQVSAAYVASGGANDTPPKPTLTSF